jgi:prepilin signal peptidase PulO-like enzyme (type II secretory pathway)
LEFLFKLPKWMMILLFASLTLFSPIGAEIPDQVRDDVGEAFYVAILAVCIYLLSAWLHI